MAQSSYASFQKPSVAPQYLQNTSWSLKNHFEVLHGFGQIGSIPPSPSPRVHPPPTHGSPNLTVKKIHWDTWELKLQIPGPLPRNWILPEKGLGISIATNDPSLSDKFGNSGLSKPHHFRPPTHDL